jgi:Tol biopolymer transport system component
VRLLLGTGLLAACLALPAAAATPSGRIVFTRDVGEQQELFSIRPDGSGLRRLTRQPDYDSEPAWSPDGRLIASFGTGGVVLRRADGSLVRRLAIPTEGSIAEVEWSPDGAWLSYLVEHCAYEDPRGYVIPPCADLWVARPDGSATRRLLDRQVDMGDGDASYSWSPAGRRLVYEALSSGATTLAIVDLDSGGTSRIRGTAGAADPVWSRRGEIAFVRGRSIYTVRPSSRGLRRLVRSTLLKRPAWAPNGRRLAYLAGESAHENRWGVWVVGADGHRRHRVGTATDDRVLTWSPDSTRLLWENLLERLIVARADRRNSARLLTRGSEADWR